VPRLPSIAADVLMWPLGYPLGVGNYAGPPFVIDHLRTGHYVQTGRINLCSGDYQPLMITVGRWLVYAGNGAIAIRADLTGHPRVLGKTSLSRGRRGRTGDHAACAHPAGGRDAGRFAAAAPRRPAQALAGRPDHARAARQPILGNGFAVTPTLIAYGTHCRDASVSANSAFKPNTGYQACSLLRVFDVRSGQLRSFRSPAGTTGWVPPEFYLENPMTPSGSMRPVAVPASAGHLFSKAPWSPDGSWLLYQGPRPAAGPESPQGPHSTLWGYNVRTRAVRSSLVPCCLYTIMAVVLGTR
jgi:hypothetical protein